MDKKTELAISLGQTIYTNTINSLTEQRDNAIKALELSEKERSKLITELRLAIPIVREYTRKNPKYYDGIYIQDPNGAHYWLNRNEHT